MLASLPADREGGRPYLRKSDLGHDDGVHRAGSVSEGLAGVTVRMILVLVDLTVLFIGVPGHGALADADVALGVDRGGLAAEVPMIEPTINLHHFSGISNRGHRY